MKILGTIQEGQFVYCSNIDISVHCNRVPVRNGHMACVSVQFTKKPSRDEILEIWNNFTSLPQSLNLPSAPKQAIIYKTHNKRPQPRLDLNNDKGMAITVGRLRDCNVLDYRFVALAHNTIRGAAGGSILIAELLKTKKMING